MRKADKISPNVIRRLPRYLRKLDELNDAGISRVSSGELGNQLGLTPSQIRQDFSCFGEFGQQGYGYKVSALRTEIANILNVGRVFSTVIVGVGKIGQALMCNFDFSQWGFDLKAAFDVKPELVGTVVNGVSIYHIDELSSYIRDNNIYAVVMCAPKDVAAELAHTVKDAGIRAIWNFTNVELASATDKEIIDLWNLYSPAYTESDRRDAVLVENVHFSDSLLSLSYYTSKQTDERAAAAAKGNI